MGEARDRRPQNRAEQQSDERGGRACRERRPRGGLKRLPKDRGEGKHSSESAISHCAFGAHKREEFIDIIGTELAQFLIAHRRHKKLHLRRQQVPELGKGKLDALFQNLLTNRRI